MSFEPAELNTFRQKLQALLGATFPKTIDISLQPEAELPTIMADVNQRNRVLLNLCVNAVTESRERLRERGRMSMEATHSAGAGQTILFVEDEPRQLALMQSFLESEGYRFMGAQDGAEAVDIFSRHKQEIAVVVLDIGLPKLNGWETFLKMKKEAAELKAIFATGYITPELEGGMARGEISGLIIKPYQLDDVLAKIAAALRSPGPRPR